MKPLEQFSEGGLEALKLCEDILDLITELPERAEQFGDSIEEKTLSIKKWAELDAVTEKQLLTLRNMLAGVEKWIK